MSKETSNSLATATYQSFGKTLLILGVVGFAFAILMSYSKWPDADNGAIPAASFLFIILGICFASPDVLEDETGGLSTMRIVVLITILVFGVVTLKLAWNLKTFDEWRIDSTWVYILGLAFGGKAFQKYSEIEAANADAEQKTMHLDDRHKSLSKEVLKKEKEEKEKV